MTDESRIYRIVRELRQQIIFGSARGGAIGAAPHSYNHPDNTRARRGGR